MRFKYKKTAGLTIAVFLLVIDRFLKALSIKLNSDTPIDLFGDWLQFDYVENYFIALSIPLGGTLILLLAGIMIAGLMIWLIRSWHMGQVVVAVFLSLIILGAASNLYDRIMFGFVVDYIGFKYLFTNNLADMMIFGGVIGLIWQTKNKPESSGLL